MMMDYRRLMSGTNHAFSGALIPSSSKHQEHELCIACLLAGIGYLSKKVNDRFH
jgi:hypothetical protein